MVAMYIDIVPNRNSPPAVLLREAWREKGKVKKRTIANLSGLSMEQVHSLRRILKGEQLVNLDDVFETERSLPHGHVEIILHTLRSIGLDKLIYSRNCRERDLVIGMIVQRIIKGRSKLETTRLWQTSTLAEELGIADADEEELYAAMDWLLARQEIIERKLAARHLEEGGLALYDVSSSYYEGHTCPLAKFGNSRDKKRGRPIIVYGLMVDAEGRPIALEVYEGNTGDPKTVPDQLDKLKGRFGLSCIVIVGDRGMLTRVQIENIKEHPGVGWISALRSTEIRKLVEGGDLQLSLFDEKNLAEISSPQFPGERLVACYNPLLAEERARKRQELLAATEQELSKVAAEAARRTKTPLTDAEIGKKVGRKLGRYKMAKHFEITIENGRLSFERKEEQIRDEAALDGIYVVRTSEPAEHISAEDTVRSYKGLAQAERVFRCVKGMNLKVRPIYHHLEDRVRAHIFLCMLAYYVEWHLRRSLAPLLFDDEQLSADRKTRDPVAPAKPSRSAKKKKTTKRTASGFPVHSFESLLDEMATRCRNYCRFGEGKDAPRIVRNTTPSAIQKEVFRLLGVTRSQ
jgi:transposase